LTTTPGDSGPQSPTSPEDDGPGPLLEHLQTAARLDINPWRVAYGGELVSRLSALHPLAGRLANHEIALTVDGWLSADGLLALAEVAESLKARMVELSGPDLTARLSVLAPEALEVPWTALGRVGLAPADSPPGPGRCPLWGPCLGRRAYLSEALADLAADLAPELGDGFRVEIAGCPLDCREAAARADLALVLDAGASGVVIWLGGRHRPFQPPVTPRPWLWREMSDVRGLLDLVFGVHDLWGRVAMAPETLPELAVRAGLERLERLVPGLAPRPSGGLDRQ
jgi:hypothetical protein